LKTANGVLKFEYKSDDLETEWIREMNHQKPQFGNHDWVPEIQE
jgi:hypothetical protein